MADVRLSYENAPPLSVPLRFFITAPVFMLAAALLLAWRGGALLQWRAEPGTIALTHLVTLGFIAQVMVGALFQMIPVLCGSAMTAPRVVGALVHGGLVAGTVTFCTGLVAGAPWLVGGAVLLACAFALFIGGAGLALARSPARTPGMGTLPLAVTALFVTMVLGLFAALARAGMAPPWLPAHLGIAHVGWGVLGWIGLLVIGVSYQVVPMFQMTPDYPQRMRRALGPALFVGLAAWTLLAGHEIGVIDVWLPRALAAGMLLFALVTLALQRRSRRQVADTTRHCFAAGMACLAAGVSIWLAGERLPAPERIPMLLGIVLLAGFAQFVILGMLIKIVPFLCWLHLNNAGVRGAKLHDFIPAGRALAQYRLHAAAVILLAMTVYIPPLARPAAVAYGASAVLLTINIAMALRHYRRERVRPPAPRAVPPWRRTGDAA
jgi:hypothetical protein